MKSTTLHCSVRSGHPGQKLSALFYHKDHLISLLPEFSNSNTNGFDMLPFQTLFAHFPVSHALILNDSKEEKGTNKDMYLMKCMSHNHGSFALCIPPPAVFVYCHPLLCNVQFRLRAPWGKELSDFICLHNGIHTYGTIEIINNNNLWQSTLLPIITYCVHSGKTQKAFLMEVE